MEWHPEVWWFSNQLYQQYGISTVVKPDDFGIMGLIMVFITVADVLVDGGLGNALIQKKNIEEKDRTTIFTANLVFHYFFLSACLS